MGDETAAKVRTTRVFRDPADRCFRKKAAGVREPSFFFLNQMNCTHFVEEIALGAGRRESPDLTRHAGGCTACSEKIRQHAVLADLFRNSSEPEIPRALLRSVKTSVAAELASRNASSTDSAGLSATFRTWLMPYSVATVASVVVMGSLLWSLVGGNALSSARIVRAPETDPLGEAVFIENGLRTERSGGERVSAGDLAKMREGFTAQSPTVNPNGSLLALAGALTAGRIGAGEIVLVANVFADGTAELEQIVQPLDDESVLFELRRAMDTDGSDAPFVPAFLDSRPDDLRVVFKIRQVEVTPENRGRSRRRK